MFERYTRPYRFIPPYRSPLWSRLTRGMMRRRWRKTLGVPRWRIDGLGHLRSSLERTAGILLTPNLSRYPDPVVMGMAACQLRQPLFYMASYHLFTGGITSWMMRRMGSYSVYREGADREAIRATVGLLGQALRPVVMFPE